MKKEKEKPHVLFFEGRWWYLAPKDSRLTYEMSMKLQGFTSRLNARRKARLRENEVAPMGVLLKALEEIAANDPFRQSSAGLIARAAIAKATGGK